MELEITILIALAVLALMLLLIVRRSHGIEGEENDQVSGAFLSDGDVQTAYIPEESEDERGEIPDDREEEGKKRGSSPVSDDDLWSDDSLHLD